MTESLENDRREQTDRRLGDRRISCEPIAGEDRRTGEDRRLAHRRREYDEAIKAAKSMLISHGLYSPDFAAAAEASERARQRLNELLSADEAVRL